MSKRKKSSDQHVLQTRSETFVPPALSLGVLTGVAIIVLAAFLAYFPALSGGFVLDDNLLLTENSLIKASDGLWRFWCTTEATDYWPASNTTLWIEWRLWGMNPTGYHVTNLILHIVEALLIWGILRMLSIPGAFWAAMIFVVHPVNVESVAWIAQRKGLLAMLFFLLSIVCYLRQFSASCSANAQHSRHTPCAGPAYRVRGLLIGPWYWLSLLAFMLAMLSKGSAAILPVLLLGIVWWRRTGTVPIFASAKMGLSPSVSRWDLLRTAPFFLVSMVLTLVNLWFMNRALGDVNRSADFTERLLGAGGVVWFYLYKALLPVDLIFVYPQWRIETDNLLWWLPLLAALIVTWALWRYRKGWSRPFLFAWGFFCVALIPVLGFTDVGYMQHSLVADHYQHIALIGVITLAAAGWSVWHERARGAAHWAAIIVAILAAGTLTFLTFRQSGLYRDAITLYQATLEKNPDSWLAHNNLGTVLSDAGRLPEAIEHYEKTLKLKPDYPEAHNNMGLALLDAGRPQEAIEHYRQALRLKPDYADAHNNLGIALAKIDRRREAIRHYRQALRLRPAYPEVHNNLGLALADEGRIEEAINNYQQALRLKPDYPDAHNNLGKTLFDSGRLQEAIAHFQQALRLKPNYLECLNNLGCALLQTGRPHEAIEQFQQVLRLRPDYISACNNLALAYAEMHQSAEAIAASQKALELARSQGKTAQAKEIEDWLNAYRDSLSK